MKQFMDDDFLLQTKTACELYHGYAEKQPIIDYHCHIKPEEIAADRKYKNITEAWLEGDHYKWRLMRTSGVFEQYITGDAPDREKFQAFAECLPKALGNPIYHWAHLELRRYFGYDGILNGDTAQEVWECCNKKLETLTVREIIRLSRVETLVTTDDPIDSLEYHSAIKADKSFKTKVLPGFRPDKLINIKKSDFAEYIEKLSEASGKKIETINELFEAVRARLNYFDSCGCKIADHGLEYIPYAPASSHEVNEIFRIAMAGASVTELQAEQYSYAVLQFLAGKYSKHGWVMQLHFGVIRNVNTLKFSVLGPDTGYDCIGGIGDAKKLTKFLNGLEKKNILPKTIIYSLNPIDNVMIDSVIGCFQGVGIPSKLQHGAAWWFNDTKKGMEEQLEGLANLSVLGDFVGMLTDSRSFLSYTRHEYFRRILCNLLGNWAEQGLVPSDMTLLSKTVTDICHDNAGRYFGL